jgi:serine/threonine protein kinase
MAQYWMAVTEPAFPWEREALSYIRQRLPEQEPFRAWSNFEFVADDGSINEVDLLVVSLYRLYLVEIKSRPGRVSGDAGTWTWHHAGRVYADDNPLLLTNRKAKKLKALLQRQKALHNVRLPYVEPVVFLSAPELHCDLTGAARTGVYLRQGTAGYADILTVLTGTLERPASGSGTLPPRIDRRLSQAIGRAIEQTGIRPSQRAQRVGDYRLQRLLRENNAYQDWEATHVRFPRILRRIRIYPQALQATTLSRTAQRQAAEREYVLLEGLQHAGILKAEGFTEHERGPALIFEHDPEAERLDLFLRTRGATLDIAQRLALVRQLAETLQYAHAHRLYHRALSPQTILISAPASPQPQVKIFDWQMAQRDSTSTEGSRSTTDNGLQLALFGDQHSLLYMAPEAIAGTAFDALKLDVFALGAVAYHVFSGRAPAANIEELHQKCHTGHGLRVSEVLDGAGQELQDLLQFSTCPTVEDRLDTVQDFLDLLASVEEELTAPAAEEIVHPLDARVNDRLEGGFVVRKRLGKGATSVALLVDLDGQEGVLKVALEPSLNTRLVEEGQILQQLRHPNIVELYDQTTVSGHAALFMAVAGVEIKSGARTLAQRLRQDGRLSLDLLQRFGEELLMVADWLEQHGISHRDIKPDNIGVGNTPAGKLTLILFDFSLANTPVDNLRAGTPPYLDPFLRRRRRWDWYAERFAVAMTLHEMATGSLPIWGDGRSDPAMLDCEVSLESTAFDPAVRDDLTAFFARTLHSDYRQRFDNAEEMRRAWQRIFAAVDRPTTETDQGTAIDLEAVLATATEATPLTSLGLSPRLLDALARVGAQTLGELLHLPRIRLYRNQGLGQQTVREIRGLAERVAQHFAVLAHGQSGAGATVSAQAVRAGTGAAGALGAEPPGGLVPGPTSPPQDPDDTPTEPRWLSVDRLVRLVVPRRLDPAAQRLLLACLGLESLAQGSAWAPQQDVAERLGVDRDTVQQVLHRVRDRWGRQAWMTELRDDIAVLVDKHGGILTTTELTIAVLAARGSAADEPVRSQYAAAVASAAVDTEMARERTRYTLYREQQHVFIVATPYLAAHYTAPPAVRAQYAVRLGLQADALAAADPLLTPPRVLEELQAVPAPDGDPRLLPDRLLRLAVAAAQTAALSSRMELYPRQMAAVRAVKLGLGALLGPKALRVQHIQQRIASRYPLAEPVPGPPLLDDLLREAGIELVWDSTAAEGQGAYCPKSLTLGVSSASSALPRHATSPHGPAASPEVEAAQAFAERLSTAIAERRFLVLTVAPRHLLDAEAALVQRFSVTRISLEAVLLREMQAVAEQAGARWDIVLQADAAAPQSADWRRLQTLVRRAMPAVEQALFTAQTPVLLVYPGLLARYEQISLLEKLRDACAQRLNAPGFLVLVAADAQHHLPMLDRTPIPVILASEWARMPEAWLTEAQRTGEGL